MKMQKKKKRTKNKILANCGTSSSIPIIHVRLELLKEKREETRNLEKVRQNIFEFDENYKPKHSKSSINPKHKKQE